MAHKLCTREPQFISRSQSSFRVFLFASEVLHVCFLVLTP